MSSLLSKLQLRFPDLFEAAFASPEDTAHLQQQLLELPEDTVEIVEEVLHKYLHGLGEESVTLDPVPETVKFEEDPIPNLDSVSWKGGMQRIAEGKFACIVMAGGQGTRLGSKDPKGMFDVGLPSGKSLLEIQAQRLLTLQRLARQLFPNERSHPCVIPWYLMCSDSTETPTREFLEKHDFFGLDRSNIVFFSQGSMPCVSLEGEILLAGPHELALSPDGNGGIFRALRKTGCIDDMRARGVEAVHCHCVDNVLVRPCDPWFMFECHSRQVDAGAAVVPKAYPEEPVGVFAVRNGVIGVVEYSEFSKERASETTESGELRFNLANIAVHYFSVPFLEKCEEWMEHSRRYHVAKKAIPHFDTKTGTMVEPSIPNGIKMEQFIFDVFEIAESFLAMEFPRSTIFSPLKNAEASSSRDNARTCREALDQLHRRWATACGVSVPEGGLLEFCPLLTYAGESLPPLLPPGHTLPPQFYPDADSIRRHLRPLTAHEGNPQ